LLLEHALDKFPEYQMKIFLRDFRTKVGWGDIFKPTIGNESLHISYDNGVRVGNFAKTKNLTDRSTFPHHIIHRDIYGHFQMGKPTFRFTI
jgi:hypothetical protein